MANYVCMYVFTLESVHVHCARLKRRANCKRKEINQSVSKQKIKGEGVDERVSDTLNLGVWIATKSFCSDIFSWQQIFNRMSYYPRRITLANAGNTRSFILQLFISAIKNLLCSIVSNAFLSAHTCIHTNYSLLVTLSSWRITLLSV